MVERKPAGATFELVAVEDRDRVPVRFIKLAIAATAVVVVALAATNLLPSGGGTAGSGLAISSSPPASPTPRPSPAATPSPGRNYVEINPGSYDIPWRPGRIRVTMPPGWAMAEAGTAIYLPEGGSRYPDTNSPSLAVHAVTGVVTDVCRAIDDVPFERVGPTVEDMTTALAALVGPEGPGPTDVLLGGYPARRFVWTDILDSCGGPEGRWLWENATGSHFALLKGGTATIYIVDVNGDRLVIASHYRGASAGEIAQLDDIIASIDIEPFPTIEPLWLGRHTLTVDGVALSFSVPAVPGLGWSRFGSVSINKSVLEPQGAEGIIYWTAFLDGARADPCANLLNLSVSPSVGDLAAAVATAPGTELVTGPSEVTVGGRAAMHVVVTVREDLGCDPGFFFTWQAEPRGSLWMTTEVGDTINVWIVDVDGTRLFIVGEIHADSGQDASDEDVWTAAEQAALGQEIEQIVDTIQFE